MIAIGKKIFYYLWVFLVLASLSLMLCNPDIFTPEHILWFLGQFSQEITLVYVLASLIRGVFLIPGLPFLVAGLLLYPNDLWLVMLITMSGVVFSATLIYYFSDALGFSKYLEKKYPEQIEKWKVRLQKPRSIFYVLAWSLFPLVPTEVICYLTGIVKMPYRHMITGVFLGHLILNILYLYVGGNLLKSLIAFFFS